VDLRRRGAVANTVGMSGSPAWPRPPGRRPSQPGRGKLESRTPAVLRSDVTSHRLADIMERRETRMYWTTPTLVEICVGLEINGYLPAEF
jgi:coenzyme PQQ precursor peptide PqqA